MPSVDVICSAVRSRRGKMMSFLEHLVNLESPTRVKAAVDNVGLVLADSAGAIGMAIEMELQPSWGDNIIARLNTSSCIARPSVLIVGHFDTAHELGTVAKQPFLVQGERAFGPGVFDMKGGLVIGLTALEAVIATCDDWNLPVTFIFNSDEEDGSWGSRPLILREAQRHDLVLILEPSEVIGEVIVSRKGGGTFRLQVVGREAHAGSAPDEGHNSILEIAHKILMLTALQNKALGTTVSPGVIRGGTKAYVVPGQCELLVDVRVADTTEQERILRALPTITGVSHVPGTSSTWDGQFHRPPMVMTERTKAYVKLLQNVSAEVGYPLRTGTSGANSDGNLTAAAGIATIDGLGPEGGRAHSPDEHILVASLEGKCCVLAAFLASIKSVESCNRNSI